MTPEEKPELMKKQMFFFYILGKNYEKGSEGNG